jgi:transposase-like protein
VLLELTVAEQRFNAVMEVMRDGLTVIEVAERYGVSRQTVHGWLRRYRTGGLDALANRPIDPGIARTRCRPRSRPTCASYAGAIQAGANAASPMSWPGSALTHRPG